jgi:hypothetical protein
LKPTRLQRIIVGVVVPTHCDEAERLWTACLNAGVAHRDSEKKELIALIGRNPQFTKFEDEIELARHCYVSTKAALKDHIANHHCLKRTDRNDASLSIGNS